VQFASESEVGRALKRKGSKSGGPVSKPVKDAARKSMTERADDLRAFQERAAEPNLVFERALKHLKQRRRAKNSHQAVRR